MTDKSKFYKYIRSVCGNNADTLLMFLNLNGFFKAPASIKYHYAFDGGVVKHSLSVLKMAVNLRHLLMAKGNFDIPWASIVKTALLHDVQKMFDYVKVDGKWEYAKNKSKKHGLGSVEIIKKFIDLTPEEEEMITWHMGPYSEYYDNHKPGDFLAWSKDRGNKYKNSALFLYFCDHLSSMYLETENEKGRP